MYVLIINFSIKWYFINSKEEKIITYARRYLKQKLKVVEVADGAQSVQTENTGNQKHDREDAEVSVTGKRGRGEPSNPNTDAEDESRLLGSIFSCVKLAAQVHP